MTISSFQSCLIFSENTFKLNNVDKSLILMSDVFDISFQNIYIELTNFLNIEYTYHFKKTGGCINSINSNVRYFMNLTLLDNWSSRRTVGIIFYDEVSFINTLKDSTNSFVKTIYIQYISSNSFK